MNITYFHRSKKSPVSIIRSFRPLIDKMQTIAQIQEYYVPYNGSLPWNLIKNIYFVYKHRNKNGINHISGDIHYCILGLLDCESVLTIHDDYAFIMAKRGILDKIFKWIFWLYLPIKIADRVICISEMTKIKIDKLVRNRKTIILPNHSVDSEFKYVPKQFEEVYPTILQVGTAYQKNLETTIKAISGINCKLRVIRKMSKEQHLLAQSFGLDYSNSYDLSDQEIVSEFANSDIVVFPSIFEGFGLPILEGQATGRVVITSNLPPMNVVSGGVAMLLDDPTDAMEYQNKILQIINNPALREKIIIDGLENARKYTVDNVLRKYLVLYNELIEQKNT